MVLSHAARTLYCFWCFRVGLWVRTSHGHTQCHCSVDHAARACVDRTHDYRGHAACRSFETPYTTSGRVSRMDTQTHTSCPCPDFRVQHGWAPCLYAPYGRSKHTHTHTYTHTLCRHDIHTRTHPLMLTRCLRACVRVCVCVCFAGQ